MKIENVADMEKCKALYAENSREDLIVQQIGLRASIHAFEYLMANESGVTPELMLAALKEQLFALHEVAAARGVLLMGYQ